MDRVARVGLIGMSHAVLPMREKVIRQVSLLLLLKDGCERGIQKVAITHYSCRQIASDTGECHRGGWASAAVGGGCIWWVENADGKGKDAEKVAAFVRNARTNLKKAVSGLAMVVDGPTSSYQIEKEGAEDSLDTGTVLVNGSESVSATPDA